jgi:rhodanese-related sulfurtransferase
VEGPLAADRQRGVGARRHRPAPFRTRSPRPGVVGVTTALAFVLLAATPTRVLAGHGFGVDVPQVSPYLLKRLLGTREVVALVDLRPADAYRKSHLPGARSVPLGDLARRAGEIPRAGRVVLYADVLVDMVEAHRLLQKRGYDNVEILEGGFAEWLKRGLPLEPGR